MEYLSVDKKWTFSLILKYLYQLLFWYCALLCIPVCARAMSWAQTNAVKSFGKYFYVKNVDNFTSVLIYLKRKEVIQSSHGSKKICLIPRVNIPGQINLKKTLLKIFLVKYDPCCETRTAIFSFKETDEYSWSYTLICVFQA